MAAWQELLLALKRKKQNAWRLALAMDEIADEKIVG
jgi:hypothetical protein